MNVVCIPLAHFLNGSDYCIFPMPLVYGSWETFFLEFTCLQIKNRCNKGKSPRSPSVPGSNLAFKFLPNKLETVALLGWDFCLHLEETVYISCERKRLLSKERLCLPKNYLQIVWYTSYGGMSMLPTLPLYLPHLEPECFVPTWPEKW